MAVTTLTAILAAGTAVAGTGEGLNQQRKAAYQGRLAGRSTTESTEASSQKAT